MSLTYIPCTQSDIADTLVQMGVKRLFSRTAGGADLSNLFENDDLLKADRLVHTAKVCYTDPDTLVRSFFSSLVHHI